MTAIADPIRTLTGAGGALTLDQMAAKLTGANEDVAAALAAIAEKGVDTTGARLADIASLVAGIQADGGGLDLTSFIPYVSGTAGSFTPVENLRKIDIDIPYDEGLVPTLVMFFVSKDNGNIEYISGNRICLGGIAVEWSQTCRIATSFGSYGADNLLSRSYRTGQGFTTAILPDFINHNTSDADLGVANRLPSEKTVTLHAGRPDTTSTNSVLQYFYAGVKYDYMMLFKKDE